MARIKHYIYRGLVAPEHPVDICVIGAGGTGSQVITGLARMTYGLKKLGHAGIDLHVFDGDAVTESNVGRQIFSPSDVGRNKAEVMVSRVNTFFGLHWEAYPQMMEHIPQLRGYKSPNIVILAIDSAEGRIKLYEKLKYSNVPYCLDIGNRARSGQVVLGTLYEIPQPDIESAYKLPTSLDLYPEMAVEEDSGPSCSFAQALTRQDLLINQWVATCALEILWKCLRRGSIEEHGAFVDLEAVTVRSLPVDPDVWKRMGYRYRKKRRKKTAA